LFKWVAIGVMVGALLGQYGGQQHQGNTHAASQDAAIGMGAQSRRGWTHHNGRNGRRLGSGSQGSGSPGGGFAQ
jgi:hypothetical protein